MEDIHKKESEKSLKSSKAFSHKSEVLFPNTIIDPVENPYSEHTPLSRFHYDDESREAT